jgi:peptidoglycan/xylan/chitin deacetylase (PgdA/CDA1 family)
VKLQDQPVPGPVRDLVGYGPNPPRARWPNDAALAVSLVVNYEEGSEYSIPAGDGRNEGLGEIAYDMPPEYRDLCTESVYEYGSRVGIWRLLRLFSEYRIQSTFFACAVALERNREVASAMIEGGHEPCSHGWRWEEHWLLSRDEEREHVNAAVELFEEVCGHRPVGWYCRYGPSVNTRELVVDEGGFIYDSDAYNDDLPYFVQVNGKRHLVVPYSMTYNDVRFSLAPGYGSPSDFVELCSRAIDQLCREADAGHPKMMSIGLHPRLIGQPGRISALREIIEGALERGNVWFATRREIAEWWLAHHEEFTP